MLRNVRTRERGNMGTWKLSVEAKWVRPPRERLNGPDTRTWAIMQ